MKITLVIAAYPLVPGKVGGVETYFKGIVAALLKHLPSRYEVKLIVGRSASAYRDFWCDNGGNIHNYVVSEVFPPIFSLFTRSYALGKAVCYPGPLREEIDRLNPDLLFFPLTVCVPFYPRRKRTFPVVTTVHDVLHKVEPAIFKSKVERIYRAATYRRTCTDTDGVIVPSQYTQITMERFFGVSPEKTAIIPYGIDFSLFSSIPGTADHAILERYGLQRRRFVIYPANTWYHKNHRGLIKAWKRLLSKLPEDVWLVLCGQIFDPLADESELEKYRIMHIGFVQQSELSALYRRSHAMVFPSLFEGFGAPPLEAMACGTVVISSRKASLAEVLPPKYPLHFDPENLEEMSATILRGCIDEDLRNKAVSAGNAFCRNFTWQETARNHIEFFDTQLNSNQRNKK